MSAEKIGSHEELVSELCDALESSNDEAKPCIDLTDQVVTVHFDRMWMSDDMLAGMDGHEIVDIEPVSSREGFRIMEDFAAGRTEGQQRRLYNALSGKHPFRVFQQALTELGSLDDWYAFKGKAYVALAEERLADSDIEFVDGKIVCHNKQLIYKFTSDDVG